jgi:hypothetical protein
MHYTTKLARDLTNYASMCRGTSGMQGDAERAEAAAEALRTHLAPKPQRKAGRKPQKAQ